MWVRKCRLCGGKIKTVLNMGKMPIVNYFPLESEIDLEEKYPLSLADCVECGLLQLNFLLSPEKLFKNYHYISGASAPLVDHLTSLAKESYRELKLNERSKILDVGCNDGSFLKALLGKAELWGVDPSKTATNLLKSERIKTINDYFGLELAKKLKVESGGFELVVSTHTLACVKDIKSFAKGIKEVLTANGVFVLEVGSGPQMIRDLSFDFIYHEHYSYFSVPNLRRLFGEEGLEAFRVEENEFHGGSIRMYFKVVNRKMEVANEKTDTSHFVAGVKKYRRGFRKIIKNLKSKKFVIVSAPAKGITLLNFCGVSADSIRFVADSTPQKQGRALPGVHSLVRKMEDLVPQIGDVYLILAWNYSDIILEQIKKVALKGSLVFVPFPKTEMIKI